MPRLGRPRDHDARRKSAVAMSYRSADGEEGYPGNLDITVTYSLTPDNGLVIDYEATTDAPTIVNPTSHAYYNLHGTTEHSTDSHLLTIHASGFTPTDAGLIPTGEILPVEGTPLDFRTPHAIGERIGRTDYEPLAFGNGYDHNWALDKPEAGTVSLAAEAYEPATGIRMKIYTDQPGLQFYAGQGMDGKEVGKRGDRHNFRSGIAPRNAEFPRRTQPRQLPVVGAASGERPTRSIRSTHSKQTSNNQPLTTETRRQTDFDRTETEPSNVVHPAVTIRREAATLCAPGRPLADKQGQKQTNKEPGKSD